MKLKWISAIYGTNESALRSKFGRHSVVAHIGNHIEDYRLLWIVPTRKPTFNAFHLFFSPTLKRGLNMDPIRKRSVAYFDCWNRVQSQTNILYQGCDLFTQMTFNFVCYLNEKDIPRSNGVVRLIDSYHWILLWLFLC